VRMGPSTPRRARLIVCVCCVAVTLEGTIIHKSGLITGGRSTHNVANNWDEKDIQGTLPTYFSPFSSPHINKATDVFKMPS
jgi:hypothetical protein